MSVAGVLCWTGPDQPADLDRLLSAMRVGPGAGGSNRAHMWNDHMWGDGVASLGCCNDATLAPPGRLDGIVALLDGRIDNRSEISRALGLDNAGASDAELLALLYRQRGEEFLKPVVGDFACVVWDGPSRRLLLGRDVIGMRPLHHWSQGGLLLFASEPRGLLACPQVPRALDERHLAAWLTLLPQQGTRSFYQGIERVPPGHLLVVEAGRSRLVRYWQPEHQPILRLPRHEDYAEALRSILDEAVRCRLPDTGAVGSWLSGGLDSPSVTALAARHLAAQGRRLTSFTAVPGMPVDPALYPNRLCDERALAAAVARDYLNIDHVLIPNDASPLCQALDRRSMVIDGPVISLANTIWVDATLRAAQQRGIRVLLDGTSGNFGISYDGTMALASLLRQGRLPRLGREAWALRRRGWGWRGILGQTLRPLMPEASWRFLARALGRREAGAYDWCAINPDFARETGVEDEAHRLAANTNRVDNGDPRRWRAMALQRSDRAMSLAGTRRMFGVDTRDPTADRRVLELCLSIPEEQFLYKGETRALIRSAMAGLLPQEILTERRRGLQSADWHVSFTAARAEMLAEVQRLEASPLACRCLDVPRLRRSLEEWPSSGWNRLDIQKNYLMALGRGISAGQFIRRIEGGNA